MAVQQQCASASSSNSSARSSESSKSPLRQGKLYIPDNIDSTRGLDDSSRSRLSTAPSSTDNLLKLLESEARESEEVAADVRIDKATESSSLTQLKWRIKNTYLHIDLPAGDDLFANPPTVIQDKFVDSAGLLFLVNPYVSEAPAAQQSGPHGGHGQGIAPPPAMGIERMHRQFVHPGVCCMRTSAGKPCLDVLRYGICKRTTGKVPSECNFCHSHKRDPLRRRKFKAQRVQDKLNGPR